MRTAITLAFVALFLTACVAGGNELLSTPSSEGLVAGFWRGLWQGMIAPITFIISLFSDSVSIYEVHNNGGWYDFGFMLGVNAAFGGGVCGTARRRRR